MHFKNEAVLHPTVKEQDSSSLLVSVTTLRFTQSLDLQHCVEHNAEVIA